MTKQPFGRVRRSHAMMLAFAVLLAAMCAGAASTRATTRLTTPRTLHIEHGTIHKFAQGGDFLTWIGGRHYVAEARSALRARPRWSSAARRPFGSSTQE